MKKGPRLLACSPGLASNHALVLNCRGRRPRLRRHVSRCVGARSLRMPIRAQAGRAPSRASRARRHSTGCRWVAPHIRGWHLHHTTSHSSAWDVAARYAAAGGACRELPWLFATGRREWRQRRECRSVRMQLGGACDN